MATTTLTRTVLFRQGVRTAAAVSRTSLRRPLCATVGVGLGAFMTASSLKPAKPLQLVDTSSTAAYSSKHNPPSKGALNPDTIRQLAGGSAAGFVAGLAISVFSKTLVLFAGIFMAAVQIAAGYGIDLIKHLQLKQRLESSRIVGLLRNHPTFKLSFALTFALAAFAHF